LHHAGHAATGFAETELTRLAGILRLLGLSPVNWARPEALVEVIDET